MSKSLTAKALQEAANDLGIELAAIRAVDEVESRGAGFSADGHVKILFERHKFHEFTKGKYDASHPNLSNSKAGGYGSSKSQYGRFSNAFALDPEAAMKSASWGRYQIMGFNYRWAGFNTVGEFVDAMKVSEDDHLKAFVKLIKAWGLTQELKSHNWAGFARQYNGAGYKRNKYDEKLAAAYEKFRREPLVTASVTEPSRPDPPEIEQPEVVTQEPAPPAAIQAPKPEVTPVAAPATSITTKIAAAASAAGPVIAATGLKIGGVEFSTGGLVAIAAVIIVGMIVGAWLWNQSQERAFARQRLSMENLASENRGNVIAAGSKV